MKKFVKYCRIRGIEASKAQLERFEELGVLYPVARVRHSKDEEERQRIEFKVEYVNGHKVYRDELGEDEEWNGEVEEVLFPFSFTSGYAGRFLKAGLLWEPASRPFTPWAVLREGSEKLESYYSLFQCYVLADVMEATTMLIRAEDYVSYRPEEVGRLIAQMAELAERRIASCREDNTENKAAAVCQVLSNRYFPFTQSNRRTIRVSGFGGDSGPDFVEYVCGWDAEAVLQNLVMTAEEIRDLQERVAREAKNIDPLESWYRLVSFVSVSQKKRLKGKALLAQTYYAMEHMLRLFYEDLTGTKLDPPDESTMWRPDTVYGEGVAADELEYLNFLTNHFDLNPKPKLLLLVEGNGEYEQFPRLIEGLFGTTAARLGIKVENLQGIASFTGDKRRDRFGALERFIDDHHSRQTYVLVVLDKEGRVSEVKMKLIKARSRYAPRTVTKPELIRLWDKSVEFDNFTDEEIAKAMTEVSGSRYEFSADEVSACRERFGAGGDPLSRLYKEKLTYERNGEMLTYGLNKPKLLKALVDTILADPDDEFDGDGNAKRPLVDILNRARELAGLNHQPVTRDIQQENQTSGHLGDPLPG